MTQRHHLATPRIGKLDIDEQKLRCKEGIFLSESGGKGWGWGGGDLICCALSVVTPSSPAFEKQGYLQQTQRRKQKAQKKSFTISHSPNCSRPAGEKWNDKNMIGHQLLIKCFGVGCSHVIFLHQAIRDLKVCSHLFFSSSWRCFSLRCVSLLMDCSVSLLRRLTPHVELSSERIEGTWQPPCCITLLFWPRGWGGGWWGGGGHALLPFVNVCASVECLNVDPPCL